MNRPSLIPVSIRVVSVSGTTPGPASGISYTVQVEGPDGLMHAALAGVRPPPTNRPDDTYETVAASVGSEWPGWIKHGRLTALIGEAKNDGTC